MDGVQDPTFDAVLDGDHTRDDCSSSSSGFGSIHRIITRDVLLMLTILLFLHANYVAFKQRQLEELPELVLSEEMVYNAAASFRVKINRVLLIAHDITLGKDFRLFFVVVVCLWILSVIGSLVSFITLAYIANTKECLVVLQAPNPRGSHSTSEYEGMLSG